MYVRTLGTMHKDLHLCCCVVSLVFAYKAIKLMLLHLTNDDTFRLHTI